MSDDSSLEFGNYIVRQDLGNALAGNGAQFDLWDPPADIPPHSPRCPTSHFAVDRCFHCNPAQAPLEPSSPSPSMFQTSCYARQHQQDRALYGQAFETPPSLSQDRQPWLADLTPTISITALNDPEVHQPQHSYGQMLHQSISSPPTTPSVSGSLVHSVGFPPFTIQESQVAFDQTQPSSESCSNDGKKFQDHLKLLKDAPNLLQGPVEQHPGAVGLWIGESRVPGDRMLSATTTSDGLASVVNDEIPPPASQASTPLSAKHRTKAEMSEQTDRNPHLCDRCSNTYPSKSELNKHKRRKHNGQKRSYKCSHEDCEQTFSYPKDLRRHIESIHLRYRFCCRDKECGSVFPRKDNRDRHERNTHGLDNAMSLSSSSQAS